MESITSYICESRNLKFDRNLEDLIQHGMPDLIPANLSQYVPFNDGIINSIFISFEYLTQSEINLHKKRHLNWFVYPDFVALRIKFQWNEQYCTEFIKLLPDIIKGKIK